MEKIEKMEKIETIIIEHPDIVQIINWNLISSFPLTEKFVMKFAEKLNWNILCQHHPLTANIVKMFGDKLHYNLLSTNRNLDKDNVLPIVIDKLDYDLAVKYQKLDKLNMNYLDMSDKYAVISVIRSQLVEPDAAIRIIHDSDAENKKDVICNIFKYQQYDEESLVRILSNIDTKECKKNAIEMILRNQNVGDAFTNKFCLGDRKLKYLAYIPLKLGKLSRSFTLSNIRNFSLTAIVKFLNFDNDSLETVLKIVLLTTKRRRRLLIELVLSISIIENINIHGLLSVVEKDLDSSDFLKILQRCRENANTSKQFSQGVAEKVDWEKELKSYDKIKELLLAGIIPGSCWRIVADFRHNNCEMLQFWEYSEIEKVSPVFKYILFGMYDRLEDLVESAANVKAYELIESALIEVYSLKGKIPKHCEAVSNELVKSGKIQDYKI